MPYNWAQLAFVEKWRLSAVRGPIIGMYRPEDRTFFDLRLRPGEGNAGPLPGPVEIHLLDAGDMIREKRVGLVATVPVIVRVVASSVTPAAPASPPSRARRLLEPGSRISGKIVELSEDHALLDAGLPVIVALPEEPGIVSLKPGDSVELIVSETPKGFLVL